MRRESGLLLFVCVLAFPGLCISQALSHHTTHK